MSVLCYLSIINKQLSFVVCIVSRTGTIVAAYLLLVLGFMGLTWVSFEAGNMRAILLLACAIIFGYIYQVIRCRLCESFQSYAFYSVLYHIYFM